MITKPDPEGRLHHYLVEVDGVDHLVVAPGGDPEVVYQAAQAAEPAPAPIAVTALQMRIALDQAGLLDDVELWLTSQPRAAQLRWEYATIFDLSDPLIGQAKVGLGIGDEAFAALVAAALAA